MRTHRHIAILLAAVLLLLTGEASAAESTRQTQAMRERVYEKLSRAQEATEAGDWKKAFDELASLQKMKDLSAHEKAQLHSAYGYAYFAQEKYAESAASYEKVLAQENLSEAMRINTLYTLGQLNFHLERYDVALDHLEAWLRVAENPGPEPYILMGQALYQLGRLDEAAQPVEQAIVVAERRNQKVRENWYALLRVIYFETKNYAKLLDVLEVLVTRYPAKEYWLHLAAAYGEMNDTERQLAAYEAAHALGYLTSGAEIVLHCQLLLQADIPYRAAVLLEEGLDTGAVADNAEHWRLLSQAWMLAQEHDEAIASLSRAAAMSDDGELYARIAQSYANLDRWAEAATAAQTALDRGVKNPQDLHLMQGMAYFELSRLDEAKAAFAEAQKAAPSRDTASRWLAYVEREEIRLRELGGQP